MVELLQFANVDLPVYGPEEPIAWNQEHVRAAGNSSNAHFLRAIVLETPPATDLMRVLDVSDEILTQAADSIGAVVLNHQWALYQRPVNRRHQLHKTAQKTHELIPKGYSLAAIVESVHETDVLTINSPRTDAIALKCAAYTFKKANDLRLNDFAVHQLMIGTTITSPYPKLRYVDIEPRLRTGYKEGMRDRY